MTIEIIVFIVFPLSFFVLAFCVNDLYHKVNGLEAKLKVMDISQTYFEWPQKGQGSSSDQGIFLQPVGSHASNPFDPPSNEKQNKHRHDWNLFAQESVTSEFVPKIYARCKDLKCGAVLDEKQITSHLNDYSNSIIEIKNICLSSYEIILDGLIKRAKELRERDETLQYLKQYPPHEFN